MDKRSSCYIVMHCLPSHEDQKDLLSLSSKEIPYSQTVRHLHKIFDEKHKMGEVYSRKIDAKHRWAAISYILRRQGSRILFIIFGAVSPFEVPRARAADSLSRVMITRKLCQLFLSLSVSYGEVLASNLSMAEVKTCRGTVLLLVNSDVLLSLT